MVTSVFVGDELVEWTAEFEESLRRAVMEAFEASVPVGLELAGIIYGRRSKSVLRLSAWRTIPAQLRSQPALPMSATEAAEYSRLVLDFMEDLELRTLSPVGWFRSRTRGMASLSPEDARVCSTLFGDKLTLALMLRPSTQRPMAAAFFHVLGETENETSRRGVEVRWLGVAPAGESRGAPAKPAAAAPVADATGLVRPARWHRVVRWLLPASAAIACLTVMGAFAYWLMDRPIRLDAQVREGKLLIQWNRHAGILTSATGAELMIGKRPVELSLEEFRAGAAEMAIPPSGPIRMQIRGPYADGQRDALTIARTPGAE
jgi:hypothetical protein